MQATESALRTDAKRETKNILATGRKCQWAVPPLGSLRKTARPSLGCKMSTRDQKERKKEEGAGWAGGEQGT